MIKMFHTMLFTVILLVLTVDAGAEKSNKVSQDLHSAESACVILLHGLARTNDSMKALSKSLSADGYHVVNHAYPSRTANIETLANEALSQAVSACEGKVSIHIVTHSLGGILVRMYLSTHKIPSLKRVVMLGPPNQGSEVVDELGNFPGFELINGPAGKELGTGPEGVPKKLGMVNFDLGVIAGDRSVNLVLSQILPGKDDGKVTIESTKVEGMKDHIVMHVTHTFMMKNKKVIEQVKYYLKNGIFKR